MADYKHIIGAPGAPMPRVPMVPRAPLALMPRARVVPIIPPLGLFFGGGPAMTDERRKELAEAATVVRGAFDKAAGHKKTTGYTAFDKDLKELRDAIDKLQKDPSDATKREAAQAALANFMLTRAKDSEVRLTKAKDPRTQLTVLEAAQKVIDLTAPETEITREFEADALTGMLKKDQGDKLLKMWKAPNGRAALDGFLKQTRTGAGAPGTDLADIASALVSLYDPEPTPPPTVQVMAWEMERSQARDDVKEQITQIGDLFKRYPNSRLLTSMRRVAVASWWMSQDPSDEGGHLDALKNRIADLEQAIKAAPGVETGFAYAVLGFASKIVERH